MSTNPLPEAAADLESALRALLGDGLSVAEETDCPVDGISPRLVATPASSEQLAAALAAANERGAAVVPWGGGWHMALGNVPARYDVALRTTKLDRVPEYVPADLTVAVESGVTMGQLRDRLAEHGQFLPIEAADDATIGGVLAAGVSGPSRHAYGLPRDWLLGCRMVLADGTVIKGGGRVVKNVAGYDLPRLAVGSLGTLGVIVEATFKVAPGPGAQETYLATYPTLQETADTLSAAEERGLALRALALADIQPGGAPTVLPFAVPGRFLAACWLAGARAAVERSAREFADLCKNANTLRLEGRDSEQWWAQVGPADARPEGGIAIRASLPPSAVVGFMERLDVLAQQAAAPVASASYPTTGLVLAQVGGAPTDQLVRVVEEARHGAAESGGSLVVTAAPLAVKERLDVWGDAGNVLPLMRRLKQQFDPKGTLNPGRFIGGL